MTDAAVAGELPRPHTLYCQGASAIAKISRLSVFHSISRRKIVMGGFI